MDNWIQTFTGEKFSISDPSIDSISILDIAHALSQLCRYTGHTDRFYSVAEHSVRVAQVLPKELKLTGLLHDAPEAYLGDVNSPLKAFLPDYREIEDRVWGVVAEKWNLPLILPLEVKQADMLLLATEKRDLMGDKGHKWSNVPEPLKGIIVPWSPLKAEAVFISQFYNYLSERAFYVHIADR